MVHTTGSANYLSYGDVAEIDSATALSFAFWYMPGTFTSDGAGILGKGSVQPFRLIWSPNFSSLTFQCSAIGSWTSFGTFVADTLYYIGVVFDGANGTTANRVRISINGGALTVSDGSPSWPAALTDGGATDFRIGRETQNDTNLINDFGHFKMWNAVLTADDFAREMHSYVPQKISNLILWCPFDDESLFGNYADTTYTATQTGTVTQTYNGEPTLYSADVREPVRSHARSATLRRASFRRLGKLVPRLSRGVLV